MQRTRSILSGVAAALLAVASPQAIAQQQPQNQQMTSPDFSQQQIESFVDAAVALQRVQSDLDAKAQQAQNPDEVARLQQEAQADAAQAIEASGLSVDEYAAIAQAANGDPELYAMIVDLMQQQALH